MNTFKGVEKPKGKKEFLRIEKPTNKIKKKIVLEKIKEVTKILNRFLHVIGLKINKEILSLLTYAYPLKALFFYLIFFFLLVANLSHGCVWGRTI